MGVNINSCPVCGAQDYEETGPSAPGFSLEIKEHIFQQPDYKILECQNCGLLYRTPILSAKDLDLYYQVVDYKKWEVSNFFPTEKAVHEKLRQVQHGAKILDFGCSSGRLLAPLADDYDCYGYEINTEAVAAASSGVKFLQTDILEQESESSFDVVVTVDTFEHFSAPMEQLRMIFTLIKNGGSLIVVTGNGDAATC